MLTRTFEFDSRSSDSSERVISATVSTDTPVRRSDFFEVLDHDSAAIDLSRAPLPVIEAHDLAQTPLAVAENLRTDGNRLRADIRFGTSARAQELFRDVQDRVVRNLSISYLVSKWQSESGGIKRAVRWQPLEVSLVAVPADAGAQFFRSQNMTNETEDQTMTRSQRRAVARQDAQSAEALAATWPAERDELLRVNQIRERAAGIPDDGTFRQMVDDAIAKKTSADVFAMQCSEYEQRMPWLKPGSSDVAIRAAYHGGKPAKRPHSGWVDRQGREVRVYAPQERMADDFSVPPETGKLFEGLTLGTYMRALAVGPRNDVEKRALSEGTASAGGHMVPTPLAPGLIDQLRAESVLIRAGARTVNMSEQTLKMARVLSSPVPGWYAEAASMSPSDPSFEGVTLTAKTLRCLVVSSRELAADAPNFDQQIAQLLRSALALELDRAGLVGSGSGAEPLGLFGSSGIATVSMGTNGATITNYDSLVDVVTAIRTANGPQPTAYIMAPRTGGQLGKLKATDNQPLVPPERIRSITQLETTSIPVNQTQGTSTDASTILAGDFSQLMIGLRQEVTVEVSNLGYMPTHQLAFVASLRADIAMVHAASFGRVTGLRA